MSLREQRMLLPEAEVASGTSEENEQAHDEEGSCYSSHLSLGDRQKTQAQRETYPRGTLVGCINAHGSHDRHQIEAVTL